MAMYKGKNGSMPYLRIGDSPSFDVPSVAGDDIDAERWMQFISVVDDVQQLYEARQTYVRKCNAELHAQLQENIAKHKAELDVCQKEIKDETEKRNRLVGESDSYKAVWYKQKQFSVERIFRITDTFSAFSPDVAADPTRMFRVMDQRIQTFASEYAVALEQRTSDVERYKADVANYERQIRNCRTAISRALARANEIKAYYSSEARTIITSYQKKANENQPEAIYELTGKREMYRGQWKSGELACPMLKHPTIFAAELSYTGDSNDQPPTTHACEVCAFIDKILNAH